MHQLQEVGGDLAYQEVARDSAHQLKEIVDRQCTRYKKYTE